MEIKELGEFGLIDHLTKDISCKNNTSSLGIGDDAAVISNLTKETLVTTHLFMEGIEFDLTYSSMDSLGYKCAMVTMSNIFAMDGVPKQMLISIGIGKRFKVTDLDLLYSGFKSACSKWGVDIIGGDTTSSFTGLTINVTCLGEANKQDIVYRSGAKPSDIICVTGNLGGAYMGLQLLEREKTVYYQQVEEFNKKVAAAKKENKNINTDYFAAERQALSSFQPDFAGKEYLIERQLKPEARGEILKELHDLDIRITSMIDISDGIASDLKHICNKSKCGCRVYEDKLPIDYQTAVTCEEFNLNLTTAALNGGEDYELLFTVPISDHIKIKDLNDVRQIGYITEANLGEYLVCRDGNELKLKAQGWIE